jgi:hypothetical protein
MRPRAYDRLLATLAPQHECDRSPFYRRSNALKGGPHVTYLGHLLLSFPHTAPSRRRSPTTHFALTHSLLTTYHQQTPLKPPPTTTCGFWSLPSPPSHYFSITFAPITFSPTFPTPPTFIQIVHFFFFVIFDSCTLLYRV